LCGSILGLAAAGMPWASAASGIGGHQWAASTRHLASALLTDKANDVISPWSLWATMAMVHAGARGRTAEQIARALNMPNNVLAFAQSWSRIHNLQRQMGSQDVQWLTDNRIWVDRSISLRAEYLKRLERDFRSSVQKLDMRRAPERARQDINNWVSKHTQRKITQLLDPGLVDEQTRVVITQAAYLKANWMHPFDVANTRDQDFELSTGQKVRLPFMHQTATHLMATVEHKNSSVQIVELPYAGDRLRMVLLIPSSAQHLQDAIATLGHGWHSGLKERLMHLAMPRWSASGAKSLSQALKGLGILDAFDAERANFLEMTVRNDLYIDAVV
jgi:serpin B